MTFRLRRGMTAEDGPGWAVVGGNGEPLPGRWATKNEAMEHGHLGVYLLSGIDVMYVQERPVEIGRRSYRYKGWTFSPSVSQGYDGWFAIFGPNSAGKRARKIVNGFSDAVRYIDTHTEAKP